MLNRHIKSSHQKVQEKPILEMKARFSCNMCNYKTTSETVLKQHFKLNHEKKTNVKSSKRKTCNVCNKQFNKETTLANHLKNDHRVATSLEGQSSIENRIQNKNTN